MTPKISIIVGLYNVASFLKEKQLSCIFNQTCSDWELILVDDGSTDETPALCDRFAEQDKRIKVIHKENGGLGSARNAGMEAATGEYLWFYDVDDEAELNVLESCIQEMNARQTDMMIFGFWAITTYQNLTEEVHFKEKEIRGQEQLRACYLDDLLFVRYGNGFAWNKVYRRSFIEQHQLRYENQRIQQDEVFNLKVYQKVNSIYLSDKLFYHYYIYKVGNTRSRFIPNRFEIYKSIYNHFMDLKKVWQISDERFEDAMQKRFYATISESLLFNLFHKDCPWNKQEKKQELHRIMHDEQVAHTMAYMKKHKMGWEQKLYYAAFSKESLFLISFCRNIFLGLRKIKSSL